MAARDLGIQRYTMFKVGKGRIAIPASVSDPISFAQQEGAVTVFKGADWKTAIPVWNVKKGMLV